MAEAHTAFWTLARCDALRRRERDLSKCIHGGRLTSILGVQRIYRLSEASQRVFEALIVGASVAIQ